MKTREELANIYTLGISRTLWKSIHPDKLNQLRTAIDLPPKETAPRRGEYDAEAVQILFATDFSSLGTTYNISKNCVLTFATCGRTPVDNEEVHLAGGGDHHSEGEW
jgi:hypothetical protein